MPLFRLECQEEGVFVVRTERDDDEICSVVFEPEVDMGGALDIRAQRSIMLSFVKILQKTCTDYWRREDGAQ